MALGLKKKLLFMDMLVLSLLKVERKAQPDNAVQ
jgi:hypothetical protein